MIFLSTPFSREAANFLNDIGVKAFKIGSGECNNYPLIEHVCKFKKPMIISTGMNDIKSIKKTVKIVEKNKIQYALLHCTNLYPTPNKLIRLNAIKELRDNFKNAVIGLSDHSENNHSVYAGLALGCSLIEKHFVDNKKKREGPDISASMDKNELVELLNASRNIHISLPGKKVPVREEKPIMQFAFASVVSTKKIKKNEKFTRKNIWVKRPGTGDFLASKFEYVLNKRSNRDLDANIQIKKELYKVKKILFFSGNRAEYSLIKPFILEFNKIGSKSKLIVSGSHLNKNLGNTIQEINKDKINIYKKIKIKENTNSLNNITKFNTKLQIEINKILKK